MHGAMSKYKINRSNAFRCLITEVSPYETPMTFSNWGAYNYYNFLINTTPPNFLSELMKSKNVTIPFNYQYYKNKYKKRALTLIHPAASEKIVDIYKNFDLNIVRLCNKSSFSIRYPHTIAKHFIVGKGKKNDIKVIEQFDENSKYASSYFSYMNYSHIHKYFESSAFTAIEKKFIFESHLDISKCFPSIYTHSLSWAIRGKDNTKKLNFKLDKSFGAKFDYFMQTVNYKETNGIVIGPEFSRIFAEIILQEIDKNIEIKMGKNGFINELNYQCVRYLDDYYVYYNEKNAYNSFIEILANELEKYKLYLNDSKNETKSRPFISNISIKKMWISNDGMSDEELLAAERKGIKLPSNMRIIDVEFPDNKIISFGQTQIFFYPKGYSDQAMIHLKNKDKQISFRIEPFLSTVKLFEEYVSLQDAQS